MGVFVAEDGRYQGWLAALLCCIAAVSEDEHPIEKRKAKAPTESRICHEQPQPLAPPAAMTSTLTMNAFKGSQPTVDAARQSFGVPNSPPSISPLDFGDRSPLRTWPVDVMSKAHSAKGNRMVISAPHSLRRLDYTDAQRKALIPLRLGPVVLRDLPTVQDAPASIENTHNTLYTRSNSTEELLEHDQSPQSAIKPLRRGSLPQIITNMIPVGQATPLKAKSNSIDETPSSRQRPSTRSPSIASLNHQSPETPASSVKSRSSSERRRLRRKRSFRKDGADRLDQEILELNTIVEERRAEAVRENLSQQHIAAVAPSMQIGARSETLNAIGSALSRPLASHDGPRDRDTTSSRPRNRRSISAGSWGNARRLSGWLSGVLPTTNTTATASRPTAAQIPGNEHPFYKCQQPLRRTQSDTSIFTCLTELDSPSLTEASSPTSRGMHSRNLTDESSRIITPLSPFAPRMEGRIRAASNVEKQEDSAWPFIVTPTTEVGLAM